MDMGVAISTWTDSGLEVTDIHSDQAFAARRVHGRNVTAQMEGMQPFSAGVC